MAITYPLSFPTNLGISSFKMGLRYASSMSESPFTFQEQVYLHSGEMWNIEVQMPSMRRDDAEEFNAFLLELKGKYGTFLFGDPNAAAPRGTWTGTPLVKGASQTGNTLLIDGLTPGATGLKGDYFTLGSGSTSRLHKLTKDFTANGSGEATAEFAPSLRASPADNAPLTTTNAKGVFRLTENTAASFSINMESQYTIGFKAREAI